MALFESEKNRQFGVSFDLLLPLLLPSTFLVDKKIAICGKFKTFK
jgi:hypothetical protein